MEKLSSTEIRNLWIKYFKSKGHNVMESAPLVPYDDDSLLFINAGVTPLKKYFDGSVVPENKRIATIQKCIRTNDIDNVGVTKRHQTFFEMMGNFSIGDYFKEEALEFAYEFLTGEEWANIPKEKIYVTVYHNDSVAAKKWVELGLAEDHIVPLEGNFWEIGEGPCGPDSEIFFDRGEEYDPNGDALEKFKEDEDQERYLEIWNNVFSQYNSKPGLSRGEYPELPNKNIDTGAGLERWCCIFQGVDSTFDTDLFVPIIKKIEELTGKEYQGEMPFKVIADHIRAVTMALSDGAVFENTGRGYVLRRLLRRSVRMGKKLGVNEPFIYKLVDTVVSIMGESYPDLENTKSEVKALVLQEEELFHKTLAAGERRLAQLIEESIDGTISGYDVFKLYDTYGFPFELTLEYLEEADMTTDKEEFRRYMEEQKKLSKDSYKQDSVMNTQNEELLNFNAKSEFIYDDDELESKVIGLLKDGSFTDVLDSDGYVVLDKTCFYATSGGQVHDKGAMKSGNFKAKVVDVIKAPNGQHLHKVELVDGKITINEKVSIRIMNDERLATQANHSSIHILQKTLQEVLSDKVHQAGSYVDHERLRFDFTFTGKISEDDILKVEELANNRISQNIDSEIREMSLEDAKKMGAMALFSEKYKDVVRVVKLGDSIELCGGTHVKNTSEIGRLAILKLESKGSNLYRIEGVTGSRIEASISDAVSHYVIEIGKQLEKAKEILEEAKKINFEYDFDIMLDQVLMDSYNAIIYNRNQLEYIQSEVRKLEKEYNTFKLNNIVSDLSYYLDNKEEINGINVVLCKVEGMDVPTLKTISDNLVNQLGKALVLLVNINGENVNFICRSTCDINAGMTVKSASSMSLGNGGGSPTFAQGGGKTTEHIDEIFASIREEVSNLGK
ncbi:MAG: alanine--tRNA ligase [Bacilli bacterium]|nr:alanine--tRNA ligase [Bacilli bacterium]